MQMVYGRFKGVIEVLFAGFMMIGALDCKEFTAW